MKCGACPPFPNAAGRKTAAQFRAAVSLKIHFSYVKTRNNLINFEVSIFVHSKWLFGIEASAV